MTKNSPEQVTTPENANIPTGTPCNEPVNNTDTSNLQEPNGNANSAENEQEPPKWFKKDKYKTIEEQAKAYSELEKKFSEKAQKLSELEKKVQDDHLKALADPNDILLINKYNSQLELYRTSKNTLVSDAVKRFTAQGLPPEVIAANVLQLNSTLDKQLETAKFALDKEYSNTANNNKKLRAQYLQEQKEKSFAETEQQIKDDLADPVIKHLFDKYKEKYIIAKDFADFLPVLKKAIEADRTERDMKSQINSQKRRIKSSSKASNGSSGSDNNSDSKPTVADLLKNDGLLQHYLK